jgi:hypothetical protein
MATLNSTLTFTGRLGNIIAYRRGGKHFLRTCPETVRQTNATRRAAKCFGAASRKGALIRGAFLPELDIHCRGSLVNRLNSAILRAGRNNHAGLTGFRFNPYTGVEKLFLKEPVFSKDGTLCIPAQYLDTPAGVTRLEVKLIASRIDFANRRVMGSDAAVLYIDPAQPFEGAELSVDVPGKGTLLVALQVRMYMNGEITHNRKYTAADILAVITEQAAVNKATGGKLPAGHAKTGLLSSGLTCATTCVSAAGSAVPAHLPNGLTHYTGGNTALHKTLLLKQPGQPATTAGGQAIIQRE